MHGRSPPFVPSLLGIILTLTNWFVEETNVA
jgi:hypothetical protein